MNTATMDIVEQVKEYQATGSDELRWLIVDGLDRYLRNLLRKLQKTNTLLRLYRIEDLMSTAVLGTVKALDRMPENPDVDMVYMKIASYVRSSLSSFMRYEKDRYDVLGKLANTVSLMTYAKIDDNSNEAFRLACSHEIMDVVFESLAEGVISNTEYIILFYRYFRHMTVKDVAERLSLSPASITNKESQALMSLHDYMNEYGGMSAFMWDGE